MKRTTLAFLALALAASAAFAQPVNNVPQVGVISATQKQYTYSAISRGLVPASSATDIFCIAGSTSRAISIKRIRITGTAGTLVTAPFTLLRRATLDTGGTAATTTALPVAAPNMSTDPASVATLVAYTANPTLNDSSPTYFRSQWLSLNVTSALVGPIPIEWDAGEAVSWFSKGLDIPKSTAGSTQQYCINLNAVSVSSGLLDIYITWVEQ